MTTINRAKLAAQHDRDQRKAAQIGLHASRFIMKDLEREAISAEKVGLNPVVVVRPRLRLLVPILVDAMIAAHLQGWLRSIFSANIAMRSRRKKAVVASVYDETLAFLRERTRMTAIQVAGLQKQYSTISFAAIDQASTRIEQAMQKTLLRIKRGNIIKSGGVETFGKALRANGITDPRSNVIETIFRTQSGIAYNVGRQRANESPEIDEILWGYEYHTVGDDRVRPTHAAMDGVTAAKDDPIWRTWTPPSGWNCRCTLTEIYRGEGARYQRTNYPPAIIDIGDVSLPVEPDPGFRVNFADIFQR